MIDFGFNGVTLRSLDSNHMAKARAWRNDPLIYQWCRQSDLIKDVDQINWYEKSCNDPTTKMYSIWSPKVVDAEDGPRQVSPLFVGVCGLTSFDWHNRRAEFSLYIGPEFQRNGYARNGLKTLLKHGFENLGLHIIWGETFFGNPALNLFLELGMKKEGVRRDFYFKKGKFIDAHLVSIKKDELKC